MTSEIADTGYTETIKSKQREILLHALNKQEFADVTFIIGQQETEYNINRIFLSLISPVFKAMLYGQMKESEPNSTVPIKDMKQEVFESIISFAYCNNPNITHENILFLLQSCDKYQIESLSKLVLQQFRSYLNDQTFLMYFYDAVKLRILNVGIGEIMVNYLSISFGTCLSAHNFLEFFNKVVELDLSDFIPICQQFLQNAEANTIETLRKNDAFLNVSLETMKLILNTQPLQCTEELLWDIVLKWAEHQSMKIGDAMNNETEDTKYDIDEKNVFDVKPQEHKLNLLKSVRDLMRFGIMDGKYFAQFVVPENVLTDKELITILLYYQQPERGCDMFKTTRRMNSKQNKQSCCSSLKYKLKHSSKNTSFSQCDGYYDLIDQDLYKRLCTLNSGHQWIEAELDGITMITRMQVGSTAWPNEITGKKVQLKDANGKWFDVMTLPVFKKTEIKTFYMIGTGSAVRILSDGCLGVGHWKLF